MLILSQKFQPIWDFCVLLKFPCILIFFKTFFLCCTVTYYFRESSVWPKLDFGISNWNQDQVSVSVSEPELFLPKPKLSSIFSSLISFLQKWKEMKDIWKLLQMVTWNYFPLFYNWLTWSSLVVYRINVLVIDMTWKFFADPLI